MNVVTPDWVKDAIFYQIFPDRFARDPDDTSAGAAGMGVQFQPWGSPPTSHSFQGGNLAGIAQRFDYLAELGVNAIYLNPISASAANHRYIAHDYYQVDPLLGGNAGFARFLDAAHARGIRVVLDGVFNHCSRGLFQFHHLLEVGAESPYVDWFHVSEWPLNAYTAGERPNYAAWWNIASLPKFNTDSPAVREFLWSVGTYWLAQGIDGWRLDVPNEIDDDEFWREFRRRCKAVNPDAYIVAELWKPAQRWLKGDQFDAQMSYLFTRAVLGFLVGRDLDQTQTRTMGYGQIRRLDGPGFNSEMDHITNKLYHPEIAYAQLLMLGSHDTPRVMTLANDDPQTVALAFLCQMTAPGAPNIYYGDEIGLNGRSDPYCRKAFPWHEPESWNTDLLAEVRRLTALRHRLAALRRGAFCPLHAAGRLAVYERRLGDERVVVAINAARRPATFQLPADFGAALGEEPVGAALGQSLRGGQTVMMPPRSGRVWSSAAL
ncbi:MAG: glycoside hydrolase family 13 protein [Candidatus Promineofilum sp.]|nr:glycoside hydrolase family 13 protein [Promineifilum sp.]